MAGPRGSTKRGGSRGGFRGGHGKKRTSPDDDDSEPRSFKKAKEYDEEEDAVQPLVPEIRKDNKGEEYVPLNPRGMRRVNVSEFKGKHFVNIREYYTIDTGETLPGKKGISLNIEQYNALVASLPLIESLLAKKGEETVRPDYDGTAAAPKDTNEADDEEGDQANAVVRDNEDEEDEE